MRRLKNSMTMQDVNGLKDKDKDNCYVFNHEDIDCLYYIGLQDIEEFNYRFELDEKLKEMK